jgi:hypothetical protein
MTGIGQDLRRPVAIIDTCNASNYSTLAGATRVSGVYETTPDNAEREMATSEQVQQVTGQQVEGMWTVAAAAQYLRVSKSWLYRQSAAGLVPVVRLGRATE